MSADTSVIDQWNCEADAERRRRIVFTTRLAGTLWFGGWLFTIGMADLSFWKGVLALVIWPYFLGVLAS